MMGLPNMSGTQDSGPHVNQPLHWPNLTRNDNTTLNHNNMKNWRYDVYAEHMTCTRACNIIYNSLFATPFTLRYHHGHIHSFFLIVFSVFWFVLVCVVLWRTICGWRRPVCLFMPKKRACRRDSTQGKSYDCPLLHTHSSPKALKSGPPIEVNAKGEAWSWVGLNFGKGHGPWILGTMK